MEKILNLHIAILELVTKRMHKKYLDSARDAIIERGILNDYFKEKIEEIEKRNIFFRYTFQLKKFLNKVAIVKLKFCNSHLFFLYFVTNVTENSLQKEYNLLK